MLNYEFYDSGRDHRLAIEYLRDVKMYRTANKLDELLKYRGDADYDIEMNIEDKLAEKALIIADYVYSELIQ